MEHPTWTAPEFEELNLGSEIGTYNEDYEDPSFSFITPTRAHTRRPIALARRLQRTQPASRGMPCG